MKKLIAALSLVLVACFAVVGLSACKKKKEDPMAKYVGAWAIYKVEEFSASGELTYSYEYEKIGESGYNTLILMADGTGICGGCDAITWELTDKGITFSLEVFDYGDYVTQKFNFVYEDGFLKQTEVDAQTNSKGVVTYKKLA